MTTTTERISLVPTLARMNLEILKDTPNSLKVKMLEEGNTNHLGTIYAGAMFNLAEFPFGLMFSTRFDLSDMYPVVGEMNIRYLLPAIGPLTVEETVSDVQWAEIDQITRAEGKLKILREIEVKNEKDEIVAITKANYFSILAKK